MTRHTALAALLTAIALVGCGHRHECKRPRMAAHRGGPPGASFGVPSGIDATGEAIERVPPDTAIADVGVEALAPTVADARAAAAATEERVLQALTSAGIDRQDIRTASLSVHPEYQHTESGRQLLGYVVANSVQIRTGRLDRLAGALDAAIAAGGDRVRLGGLRFELEQDDEVRARLRERAAADARASAEQLARALGVALGLPAYVEELQLGQPGPIPFGGRMELASAGPTPIEPGTVEVRVAVRTRFHIAKGPRLAPGTN